MRTYCARTGLLVTCLLFVGAVKMSPLSLIETRFRHFGLSLPAMNESTTISVQVHASGPELEGSREYGNVVITAATDDLGTNLVPPKRDAARVEKFEEIHRYFDSQKKETDGFEFTFYVMLPPRNATTITSIKGQFEVLAGGKDEVVTLTKLLSNAGKPAVDPMLKAAGITVTPVTAKRPNEVAIEFSGDPDLLQDIELLDANDQSISGDTSDSTAKAPGIWIDTYSIQKPLDDSVVIKLRLWRGREKRTVKFEMTDLKLP
ncbi:hypothetical protein BH10PLA1_BH10PLA1_20690 [soil metagenome]